MRIFMKIMVKYLSVLLLSICQVCIISEVLGNSIEEKQQLDSITISLTKFKKESENSNLITPNNILIPEIAKIIEYSLKNNINFLSKVVDHTSEKDKEGNIPKS